MEAEEGFTASAIGHLPNAEVVIDDGGHIFPVMDITRFIDEHTSQPTNTR